MMKRVHGKGKLDSLLREMRNSYEYLDSDRKMSKPSFNSSVSKCMQTAQAMASYRFNLSLTLFISNFLWMTKPNALRNNTIQVSIPNRQSINPIRIHKAQELLPYRKPTQIYIRSKPL
jgi:hypothetical protein